MDITVPLHDLSTLGKDLYVIVITGGPCSGKTTGLIRLRAMLAASGYKVLVSPESATKLIMGGIVPGETRGLSAAEFQRHILLDTLTQEQCYISAAQHYRDLGGKVVVLCDRGAIDGMAYAGESAFREILSRLGLTPQQVCEKRYHAVMHLTTAALGAEAHYTLANNAARMETLEEAREMDHRILQAWQRHPHPRVIDNSTDFEQKIERLFAEVTAVLQSAE